MEISDMIIVLVVIISLGCMMGYNIIVIDNMHDEIRDVKYHMKYGPNKSISMLDMIGFYDGNLLVIQTEDQSYKTVEDTMLHEFAHYYQDTKISEKDLNDWKWIHNISDIYISNYAKTNHKEDFAESFEHIFDICYYPDKLNDLDEIKANYFKINVLKDFKTCGDEE